VATYNEAKIVLALLARYDSLSVSGVTAKQHPDQPFTAPTGAPYLRAAWMPAMTAAPCLGNADSQDYRGVFQVDLFQPLASGENVPSERLGAIISHFKRGTSMTQDSLTVKVHRPPSRGPAIRSDGWMQYPVSIYVQAFKAQV
jgi:hypothetical protein